jgi:GNAT superfamily N-acetyltransferase
VTVEYLADRREFIPTAARWHHEEWGHLRPGETVEDRAVRVERDCGHREIPTTFVALAGHQCLGSASLVACDMDIRPALTPWLSGVFVAPEHRRRGVGAALVERVVQEARALGKPRLYLLHARFWRSVSQTWLVRCRTHILSRAMGRAGDHDYGVCHPCTLTRRCRHRGDVFRLYHFRAASDH